MTTYRRCEACGRFGVVDRVCEKCGRIKHEDGDFFVNAVNCDIPIRQAEYDAQAGTVTLPGGTWHLSDGSRVEVRDGTWKTVAVKRADEA